jgi:hypothetical protein
MSGDKETKTAHSTEILVSPSSTSLLQEKESATETKILFLKCTTSPIPNQEATTKENYRLICEHGALI